MVDPYRLDGRQRREQSQHARPRLDAESGDEHDRLRLCYRKQGHLSGDVRLRPGEPRQRLYRVYPGPRAICRPAISVLPPHGVFLSARNWTPTAWSFPWCVFPTENPGPSVRTPRTVISTSTTRPMVQKGCIIFRPASIDEYRDGDRFFVYIAGLDGRSAMEVHFFDAERFYAAPAPTPDSPTRNEFGDPVLTWSMPDKAESCNLYRKPAGGKWELIASELDDRFYEDVETEPGVQYYYRCTSLRTVGGTLYESLPSAAKSVTTPLSKPKIKYLRVSGRGATPSKWRPVSKTSGYKVYRE